MRRILTYIFNPSVQNTRAAAKTARAAFEHKLSMFWDIKLNQKSRKILIAMRFIMISMM